MSPSSPESAISFSFSSAGVVLEQVADHQRPARRLGRRQHPLGVRHRLRQRLLHEAVLAGLEHAHGEVRVAGHVGRHHHGVEVGVGQQVVDRRGLAGARELRLQRARASSEASQIQRSSGPGRLSKLRARFGPQ